MAETDLDELVCRYDKIVPFVGDFCSSVPPASIPAWWKLVSLALFSIESVVPEAKALSLRDKVFQQPYDTTVGCAAEIFESLYKRLGPTFLEVLKFLDGDITPNYHHKWLASFVISKKFPVVLMTTIDLCLETALLSEGIDVKYLTGNMTDDRALIEKQTKVDEAVHVFVACSVSAIKVVTQLNNIIGKENFCFIIKIHGSASQPETCLNNFRDEPPSSTVAYLLGYLVQMYPMFCLGTGGEEMNQNLSYLKLKTIKTVVDIFWLANDDKVPCAAIINDFNRDRSPQKLHILNIGSFGDVSELNRDLVQKVQDWARGIGELWCRICSVDVAINTFLDKNDIIALASPLIDVSGTLSSRMVQERIASKLTDMRPDAPISKISTLCFTVVKNLRICYGDPINSSKSALISAFEAATSAMKLTRSTFPSPEMFSDYWMPTFLFSCVVNELGNPELALTFLEDALQLAVIIDNIQGRDICSKALLMYSLSEPSILKKSEIDFINNLRECSTLKLNETLVYMPMFESFRSSSSSNSGGYFVPDHIMLKAMIHRAMLVSDRLAIPVTAMVDCRDLILQVLYDNGSVLKEEYLYFIRPILPKSLRTSDGLVTVERFRRPLLDFRLHCLAYTTEGIHADISLKLIEEIDDFYLSHPELLLWVESIDTSPIYERRVQTLLNSNSSTQYLKTVHNIKETEVKQVMDSMNHFSRLLTQNQAVFARAQFYHFGNIFMFDDWPRERFQEFYNEIWANCTEDEKNVFLDSRDLILEKPWIFSQVVKDLADSPQKTCLTLEYGLNLCLDDQMKRHFDLISTIISEEDNLPIPHLTESISSIRVFEVASLSFPTMLQIKQSSSAKSFFLTLQKIRSGVSKLSALRSVTSNYLDTIKSNIILPEQRDIPSLSTVTKSKKIIPFKTHFQKVSTKVSLHPHLIDNLFVSITKEEIKPRRDIPTLAFPNLILFDSESSLA